MTTFPTDETALVALATFETAEETFTTVITILAIIATCWRPGTGINDIGLTVLSFVPGLGVAAMAAKVVILAVRVISAVSKVQKVAKVVKTIGNAVKRTSNALKAKTPKKTANSCRTNSFVPGTEVLMADHSTKPIEDVELGDLVLATDPLTGETVAQEVTDLIIGSGSKDLVSISTDTNLDRFFEKVVATDGHPFWTDLRGWVDAGDLVVGDQLRGGSGELIAVTGVATESRVAIVYNLTVANFHTYYVMIEDQEALTHNCNNAGVRKSKDQQAVLDLVRGKKSLPRADAKVIAKWAKEYKIGGSHGVKSHKLRDPRSRPGPWQSPHIKVNGKHIRVTR